MSGTLEISLEAPAEIESLAVVQGRMAAAMSHVHGTLGIPEPAVPTVRNDDLPPSIEHLRDEQLGELLNTYGQWIGYLSYQVARASGEMGNAQAHLIFTKSRIRTEIKKQGTEKRTVQDKNDIVETHPRVKEATDAFLFWSTVHELTKSLRDRSQVNWDTISRRITQKGQEVDRMRREANVAGVPSAAYNPRAFRTG